MRRFVGSTAVAALVFAAACGDFNEGTTPSQQARAPRSASATAPVPGTCTTLPELITMTNTLFGAGSPNANSVIGKLNNLAHHVAIGNFAEAKGQAFNTVEFVLKKVATGGLPGTAQDAVNLVNGIFCFAGLSLQINDPSGSFLVYPTDEAQILQVPGVAGTSLPPNPVSEPTLITINLIPDTFDPGQGPLDTKLDQYPGFASFTHQSENNLPFTQPVVVAVCADPGIPADVRARLRLGHDADAGFEITPPANADFLQCPTSIAQTGLRGFFGRLANLVLPKVLYARQDDFSGGVGGTAGEYSDFGPIDPNAGLSGGVGGTAGEYLRTAMLRANLGGGCPVVEAPVGSPLSADCLPLLTITTPLGTPLSGVPIQWNVTAGGGQIAPRSNGICGTFGSSGSTATSPLGKTGVCWTLGAEGLNSVVATPSAGGDAPAGTNFTPATITFNATANPPVAVEFVQQPPANIIAGTPFDVTAKIVDKNGTQVMGSNAAVTLTPNKNSFADGVASVTANASQGFVTFSGLRITAAATGYTLTATSAVITAPNTPPVTNSFNVLAGAAASIAIVQGNNQTAAANTTLPINPTVRVSDQYNNPVAASITWTPGLSSSGSVGASPTNTGIDGTAFTTWTIGDGANQLTASVGGLASLSVVFDATGTSTLSVLNQCLPAGGGDPINDAGKQYAFYIPNPGKNKTIRQIQVYLSSTGRANVPTPYQVQMTTQMGTFDPAVSAPQGTTTTVSLRGNNSEKKLTTFALATPIVGTQNGPDIMIRLNVLTNPDGSTLNFNTGECSPGNNCKPARSCQVTEVNSVTPFPAGTAYRKSVALTVKGN
ncbi:MAG TPA: hypothetical protein VJR92_04500 [Gemmatimonadaceae bacterium]|nr:hypothetical protein [Gemmatimonadaceae bacterium]